MTINQDERNYFAEAILNPNMTFDSLAVGPCNESVIQSCKLLVKQYPSSMLSPLLLVGEGGLGKTHLASAIGNALSQANPGLRVLFTTAADFCSEYIQFAQNDQAKDLFIRFFKENVDALIIDDLDYLLDKPSSAKMISFFINDFVRSDKPVIATCNPIIWEIDEVTRVFSGDPWKFFPLRLKGPDPSTAKEFIRIAMESGKGAHVQIDEKVIDRIIAAFSDNFRTLSMAINRILFYAVFVVETQYVDMDMAKRALDGLWPSD